MRKRILFLLFLFAILYSCASLPQGAGYYAPDPNNLPRFVTTDILDLNQISNISRFRSKAGHDFNDGFESQRSMKHYFYPKTAFGNSSNLITVTSPVNGILSMKYDEHYRSFQIRIQPSEYPYVSFVVFHVSTILEQGDVLTQGQFIGYANVTTDRTEPGASSDFDIAVWLNSGHLVSYFDVMSESLFSNYIARGLSNRSDIIIDKATADLDTRSFSDGNNYLLDWFILTP